jgi:hypothetical protein
MSILISFPCFCILFSRFFFDTTGAKKKLSKRNAENISPSAEGDEGYAPSTAQAFEKA